jgi:hypothetical protein
VDSTRAGTADPVCPTWLGTSVRPIYLPALQRYVQLGEESPSRTLTRMVTSPVF